MIFQVWLMIASILACFNIGKAKDEFGNEIKLDDSYIEFGVVLYGPKHLRMVEAS